MAQTPDTNAGALTERIMAQVRVRIPDLSTRHYNRIYEAALAVLQDAERSPVVPSGIKFPDGEGMFIRRPTRPVWVCVVCDRHAIDYDEKEARNNMKFAGQQCPHTNIVEK